MHEKKDYKFWLSVSDVEPDGNLIWFIPREINAIFTLDINTGKTEFRHVLDLYKIYQTVGYMRTIKYGNKLFVIPFASTDGIKVYDIEKNKIETIKIREAEDFSERFKKKKSGVIRHFLECEIYKGKMYLIGIDYPAIVELDLQTYECDYFDDYMKKLFNEGDLTDINYLYYFIRRGDSILCPSSNSNVVVEFNMKNKSFIYHRVGDIANRYGFILGKDDEYWLTSTLPYKGITKWNYKDNSDCISQNYPSECDYSRCLAGTSGFYVPVWLGKKIIQFPDSVNMAIEYDTISDNIRTYEKMNWLFHENELNGRWFTTIRQMGRFTYAYVNSSHRLLIFDANLNPVKRYEPYLDYEEKAKLVSKIKRYVCGIGSYTVNIYYERDALDQELFFSFIASMNDFRQNNSDKKFVGKRIYEHIK